MKVLLGLDRRLAPVERVELHLDVAGQDLEWQRLLDGLLPLTWIGHELERHALITLHERVDDELVRSRLELEMLPRGHRQADRERREERRDVGAVGDDALHPAGAMSDDLAAAHVPIGHRLPQERSQQVIDVDRVRGQAAVDEELGGQLEGHRRS